MLLSAKRFADSLENPQVLVQIAMGNTTQNLVRFAPVLVCLALTKDLELVAGAGGMHRLIALAG